MTDFGLSEGATFSRALGARYHGVRGQEAEALARLASGPPVGPVCPECGKVFTGYCISVDCRYGEMGQ